MAVTITPLSLTGTLKVIRDADADATSETNVNDGAATIYAITIDNAANAAIEYLHLFNSTAAPSVGTTDPDVVLMVNASVARTYVFRNSLNLGTGLCMAAKTVGGTAGTTGPTSDMIVNVVVG